MTTLFYGIFDHVIITGLETFVLWYLLREKVSDKSRLVKLLYYVGCCLIVSTTTMLNFPVAVKLIPQALYITLVGRKIYKDSFSNFLLIYLVYTVTLLCGELIAVQAWNLISDKPVLVEHFEERNVYRVQIAVLAKAIGFGLIVIVDRLLKFRHEKNAFRDLLHFFVSIVTSLAVMLCMFSSAVSLGQVRYNWIFLFCAILILISLIYNTIATNSYLEMKKEEQIEKYQNYELDLRCQYYQSKLRDQEKIKETYHDFKNHLLILENNKESNSEIKEMIADLKDKVSPYENYYNTGNEYLDIILNEKVALAKESGIHMDVYIDSLDIGFMEPIDISTIFGNLFDNAIEASSQNSEENRYISLHIAFKNHMVSIIMKNEIEKSLNLITSKANKDMHGYGIANIKKAVNKYAGACSIEAEDSYFVFSIIIPVE